jgi:glycerol 3-phosphatase-1
MEGLLPLNHAESAIEIPGARSLLTSLISLSAPWAIVTSGSIPLVTGWLQVLNLPTPEHLITAESVTNGKPDPACYRMGRERLGLAGDEKRLLVLEDAPAGIKAGKAAGCVVVGLVTSHSVEEVLAAGPDYVVRDLESVRVARAEAGRVVVEVRDGLVVKGM